MTSLKKNRILKFRFRSKKVNNIIDELNYKQIIIRGFEPFYVKYKTDSDYLKQHQAKDVKEKDVRQNLLEPSIGYLHTYGNDYECKITECSEKENYIVVQIPFEQSVQKQTFQFAFSEEQSVSQLSTGTIICIVILTAGVVALVLTLSIHFIRNKKHRGFSEQNDLNQ